MQDPIFDRPRAVIHLINKKPDYIFEGMTEKERRQAASFSIEDLHKLDDFSKTIGICHANINKIEQLHSMSGVSSSLQYANNEMMYTSD